MKVTMMPIRYNQQRTGTVEIDQNTEKSPGDLSHSDSNGKPTYRIVDFAISADHRVKLKESEKNDKYQELARELKKLWNMKVMVIPTVIGALGSVTKGLVHGLEDLEIGGRVKII